MYYPYLRGKQYELIALREIVEKNLINDKIIPIVEPVKASPALLNFMEAYIKANKKFGIIYNPECGSFFQEIEDNGMEEYLDNFHSFINKNNCCLPVYILNKNINKTEPLQIKQKAIAICADVDIIPNLPMLVDKYNIDEYLIPDERIFKREIKGRKILLSDNFKKLPRNADYAKAIDEYFSDDHLYFKEEGFKGFSDYSIIGKEYTDSGFAPYAVVIHMIYFDSGEKLRVHHFVSDSNEDYDDPAGKLEEALEKFVKASFLDKSTFAYNEFKKFHDNRMYSGLGVIKKLSLMHHFEIMSQYLQNK
jgi:hypothetical protein